MYTCVTLFRATMVSERDSYRVLSSQITQAVDRITGYNTGTILRVDCAAAGDRIKVTLQARK